MELSVLTKEFLYKRTWLVSELLPGNLSVPLLECWRHPPSCTSAPSQPGCPWDLRLPSMQLKEREGEEAFPELAACSVLGPCSSRQDCSWENFLFVDAKPNGIRHLCRDDSFSNQWFALLLTWSCWELLNLFL